MDVSLRIVWTLSSVSVILVLLQMGAPFPGFPNRGNTCYLAVAMGLLFIALDLRRLKVDLGWLRKELDARRRKFNAKAFGTQQQDAGEAMSCILDAVTKARWRCFSFLGSSGIWPDSPPLQDAGEENVNHVFGWTAIEVATCTNCGAKTTIGGSCANREMHFQELYHDVPSVSPARDGPKAAPSPCAKGDDVSASRSPVYRGGTG